MKQSAIQEIGISQKAALNARDTGLERTLLPELPDSTSHALIVSGIRRCGKSTLLHQFVKKQEREIQGLLEAMDFFQGTSGVIITRDTKDIILEKGKKLEIVPAWNFGSANYANTANGASEPEYSLLYGKIGTI